MPTGRAAIIAATASVGLVLYALLWFHWPVSISVGIGAILGTSVLATSVGLGRDASEADEAWREAAPDLLDPPAGPQAAVIPSRAPGGPSRAPGSQKPPAASGGFVE